ncbi:putative very-long-chain (3R)-3-hydroxyacyl-CoA dehydratase [[Candida] jaroonii]|uniref:Very-long-chain (3R)-3-hydroxyacyl-CoA dehydratase n=1 Tax=[Candida] jaroonii TaxID=467808 RepID=A0ACA9Y9B2_9ASCO|nr:putative very-long-chain (3R)-3-hydroxyacyl-CoA dehydratase [[Candida] jaroonii]
MAHLYPLPTNYKLVFFHNVCSFTVWFCCFGRFLVLLPLVGRKFLPGGIADFFHIVSVLPFIGFLLVKSCIGVGFSKYDLWALFNSIKMIWICYGVIFPHPKIAKHTSYSFLISSWCIMYMIHYSYYAFRIKTKSSPKFLFWLNFHHHYFTFPVAIISEMILVFLSLGFAEENSWVEIGLKFTMLAYIPIGYFQWEYLNGQRLIRYNDLKKKIESSSTRNDDGTPPRNTSLSPLQNQEDIQLRTIPSNSRS